MDKKAKIGQALKELRLKKQLKQSEVAEILGISSQQTYQKYESGIACPPYEILCDFADFYGVTTDYLLGREPKNPMLELPTKPISDDEFVKMYESLPPFAKEIFVEVMAKLSKAAQENIKQQKKEEAPAPVPEPQKETPPIQVKQGQKQNWAIARTSNPEKQYIPAPTDEMMELFTPLTPEDLGEK